MKKDKKAKKFEKVQKQQEVEIINLDKTVEVMKNFRDKIMSKNVTLDFNLSEKLRKQADEKNTIDCQVVLNELEEASNNGEYVKTIQLKVNQVYFFEKLGLTIKPDKNYGFFEISWK